MRRFGDRARRIATFCVLPLISTLIVPGPIVATADVGEVQVDGIGGPRRRLGGLRRANAEGTLSDREAWEGTLSALCGHHHQTRSCGSSAWDNPSATASTSTLAVSPAACFSAIAEPKHSSAPISVTTA